MHPERRFSPALATLDRSALPSKSDISANSHHLLLRPVPGYPGVALHLVLLASTSNLTLARMQLERVEPPR